MTLHIALKPKQSAAETAETTAAAETAETTVAPPQHVGGTITIAAAASADGIVAESNSHMHAPEPDQWSNIITNFDLAFATTAEPNDASDHDFPKQQSQSPKPSYSNIRLRGLPREVWRDQAEAACDAETEAAYDAEAEAASEMWQPQRPKAPTYSRSGTQTRGNVVLSDTETRQVSSGSLIRLGELRQRAHRVLCRPQIVRGKTQVWTEHLQHPIDDGDDRRCTIFAKQVSAERLRLNPGHGQALEH